MWIAVGTRPDIMFWTSYLSRFSHNPGIKHMEGMQQLLKYLNATRGYKIDYLKGDASYIVNAYSNQTLKLEGHTDANLALEMIDSKQTSGYIFVMNGAPIAWKTSKQQVPATSSCESEYYAVCDCTKVGVWIKKFMDEIVVGDDSQPITIRIDNQAATFIANNSNCGKRARHIFSQYH